MANQDWKLFAFASSALRCAVALLTRACAAGFAAVLVGFSSYSLAQPASYDLASGVLTLPAVKVGSTAYSSVTLQNIGNFTFKLQGATELVPPPASISIVYDSATSLLSIPKVQVGAATYVNVTLLNAGSFTFNLQSASAAEAAVSTLAGLAGVTGSADGSGSAARFYSPEGVAVDSLGNVFVASGVNRNVRKITPAGVVTTFAGSAGLTGSADGTGTAARFLAPCGVAVDALNNVYVADGGNNNVRKITPDAVVTTFAGLAGTEGSVDGTGTDARFFTPCGIATDGLDNVYVADVNNLTIRRITPAGVVSTLAGLAGVSGNADGTGAAARFALPRSVATDSAGNIFVADTLNHTIRRITPAGVVSTVAGVAGLSGSVDGTGSAARFLFPGGVAVDGAGNVLVADTDNHTIRKMTPTGAVGTYAGTAGAAGSADGLGSAARFRSPAGIAADAAGNVYVADRSNHTIRKTTPP